MSFQDEYKITSADRLDKGVYGLPDTPGMTAAAIQERFDSLGNLAIDKFNALVEAASDVVDGSDTKFPTNKAVQDYISGEGGAIIDDTTPSLHKAYSSQKVENMFGDVASRVIDDETPSANKTYSSAEIEEKLSDIPSPESIIDDDTASSDTTYSSSKLESDFISVSDTEEQTATDEFTTINGGLLSSLKVALSPNQDLHGYSEPWVGGASKNKLPMTLADIIALNTDGTWNGNTYTFRGIDYTVLVDDANNIIGFDTNGTATQRGWFFITEYDFGETDAVYNNVTVGGYIFTAGNSAYIDNQQMIYYNHGSKRTYFIMDGITTNHVKWYPMVRLSSESDPTFEPYSNICPISGHTQVEVGDDGKNCLPNDATDQTVSGVAFKKNNDGSLTLNGQSTADWAGITLTSAKFLKAGTYTVSCPRVNSVDTRLIISYDGAEKVNTYNVDYKTFTLSEDKTISVRFVIRNSGVSFSNVTYYPMIEKGSIKTDYVPYNGYQVTVNLGGTYYSGILDVVSGVFVPDMAEVDLGSLTFNRSEISGVGYRYYASDLTDIIKYPTDVSVLPNIVCEQYAPKLPSQYNQAVDGITVYINGSIQIYDSTRNTLSVSDFKTAMSGVQLVYELANPTPIQLSPTMVKALVGENHLSAPLEGQEITESIYSPLAKWNAVIDDTTASDDTTYSSNKINAIVPKIDDTTTSASKVFSSLKTAALITELSERFDFSTTEKPLGWWTDGKVYYGKVINIMGCPKEMFGLMVDLGVEVDTFIGIFAVGNAKDDNYNGGYCMGGTIYCKVIKSEGQNTQIQPACAVMALGGASLLVLYTKVE